MQYLVSRIVRLAFVRGWRILRYSTNDSIELNEGELISDEHEVRTRHMRPS